MSNSTFFKMAVLVILSGIIVYFVLPKYQIKSVSYNHTVTMPSGEHSTTEEVKTLIKANLITGEVKVFRSSGRLLNGTLLEGEYVYEQGWDSIEKSGNIKGKYL